MVHHSMLHSQWFCETALTWRVSFEKREKLITRGLRMHYLELMEFPFDSLEMDYIRRLCLSSSPEAQGLPNALKHRTMVKL